MKLTHLAFIKCMKYLNACYSKSMGQEQLESWYDYFRNVSYSTFSKAIKEIVAKILDNNPQSIADYKAGKDRALGFLVGQAMKETKGKANPQMLNKLFLDELIK